MSEVRRNVVDDDDDLNLMKSYRSGFCVNIEYVEKKNQSKSDCIIQGV